MAPKSDYTDKAMENHAKTYEGFLTLLKAGIGVSLFGLMCLIIVYNV